MITHLYFPYIDLLQERFGIESKPFFKSLTPHQRKQIRIYTNYKKSKHIQKWSFLNYTEISLTQTNKMAKEYYFKQIKYKQLKLDI